MFFIQLIKEKFKKKKYIEEKTQKEIKTEEPEIKEKVIRTSTLCDASEIGKWFVNECLRREYKINTIKLEKLLVMAYGEYLVRTGKKLFNEKIELWQTGVMIKMVDRDYIYYALGFDTPFFESYKLSDEQIEVLSDVISVYGHMDAFEIDDDPRLQRLKSYKSDRRIIPDNAFRKVFKKLKIAC